MLPTLEFGPPIVGCPVALGGACLLADTAARIITAIPIANRNGAALRIQRACLPLASIATPRFGLHVRRTPSFELEPRHHRVLTTLRLQQNERHKRRNRLPIAPRPARTSRDLPA